jgi:hypothetical protein
MSAKFKVYRELFFGCEIFFFFLHVSVDKADVFVPLASHDFHISVQMNALCKMKQLSCSVVANL